METTPSSGQTGAANTNTGFLRSPITTRVAFGIALLMFLLPFAEIRCNGTALAKASGTDLAFGFEMKQSKTVDNWSNAFDFNSDNTSVDVQSKRNRKEPNSFALAALLLAAAGLGISFLSFRSKPLITMVAGMLGAVSLLVLMIQLKGDMKNEIRDQANNNFDMNISLAFTSWYFICLLSFAAAAFFCYRQYQYGMEGAIRDLHKKEVDNIGGQSG